MFRIQRHILQRPACGAKEQAVDNAWILKSQWGKGLRNGEDDMSIGHRQYLGLACFEPGRLGTALALRAVAVSTRVVRDPLVSAGITRFDVTTQPRCAAGRNRVNDRTLLPAPGGDSYLGTRRRTASPEDLGQLVPGSLGHLLGRDDLRL